MQKPEEITVERNGETWTLDGWLINLRGADLKAEAERHGVKVGKRKVDEIRADIRQKMVDIANLPVPGGDEVEKPVTRTTALVDRVGPTAIVTDDGDNLTVDDMHDTGLYFTAPVGTPEPTAGEPLGPEWINLGYTHEGLQESVDVRMPEVTRDDALRMMADFNATYPGIKSLIRAIGIRRIVRAERARASRFYGDGGRGMGAKHFVTPRQAEREEEERMGLLTPDPDALRPMSHAARIRAYAGQNGKPTSTTSLMISAQLTPKQWRRAIKKQNHASKVGKSFATKGSN